jgi:hypothetical protein
MSDIEDRENFAGELEDDFKRQPNQSLDSGENTFQHLFEFAEDGQVVRGIIMDFVTVDVI